MEVELDHYLGKWILKIVELDVNGIGLSITKWTLVLKIGFKN